MRHVRLAILGAGVVGSAFIRRVALQRASIRDRFGIDISVNRVAVKNPGKPRSFNLSGAIMCDNALEVVGRPDVDIVIETIGGLEPAGQAVLSALSLGRPVITSNKELVAMNGPLLARAANRSGALLMFEATTCGCLPIIRLLNGSLAGETIHRISGIFNSTTNFILTSMGQGSSYEDALVKAQALGYSEADPSDDVSGRDAMFKTAILGSLAFRRRVEPGMIDVTGIQDIVRSDVADAMLRGRAIRLLGVAELRGKRIDATVAPRDVEGSHPFASVDGSDNAVLVEGPSIGRLFISGPGAGGEPTASALMADLLHVVTERRLDVRFT